MSNAHKVSQAVASETNRLHQAISIVGLVIESIGDEVEDGKPAIVPALRAASAVISASIDALDSVLEVSHG